MRRGWYIVYGWFKEEKPYYLSVCRYGSNAPWENNKKHCSVPDSNDDIRIVFKSQTSDKCIQKLDELEYHYGLKDACEDGTLFKDIRHNPKSIRFCSPGQSIPVDVWTTEGVLVGKFMSIGEAANRLELNASTCSQVLSGTQYSTAGYVITHKDEDFSLRLPPRNSDKKKPLLAYDPEGVVHQFDSVREATLHIFGKLSSRRSVQNSIQSPTDKKSAAKGWYLFDDELPDYHLIKKK